MGVLAIRLIDQCGKEVIKLTCTLSECDVGVIGPPYLNLWNLPLNFAIVHCLQNLCCFDVNFHEEEVNFIVHAGVILILSSTE